MSQGTNSPNPDLGQLRDDARDLNRAVSGGDAAAISRVVSSHPKFAGRPPDRLRPEALTLRDAQATIAAEQGFATWSELVDALTLSSTGKPLMRWNEGVDHSLLRRAFEEAGSAGNSWCGPEHLLLAVLHPADATVASAVLADAGLSYESLRARVEHWGYGPEREGVITNPAWHKCIGLAGGLALATGSPTVDDEHALLALLYSGMHDEVFDLFDVTRAEIVESLAVRGVTVPPMAPSEPPPRHGPMGPRVYYPASEHDRVLPGVREHIESGVHWGWNTNGTDLCWINAEDDVDLPALVRQFVTDPDELEIVPWEEAVRRDDFNRQPPPVVE